LSSYRAPWWLPGGHLQTLAAAPWLERIAVPTLLLNAGNDPFLPAAALERATRRSSREVLLDSPPTGGHVGFPGRREWLARRILEFLSQS